MGSVSHGDLSAHQQALQKRNNKLEAAESKRNDERLTSVLALSQYRTHMALFPTESHCHFLGRTIDPLAQALEP